MPAIVAHRGASATHPENTRAAFDAALAAGADGIELDVQLSRDGVPVVYHDRTLTRAGGGRRYVSSATADEIAALATGGEPVPTLRDVLVRYSPRTRLLVELKVHRRDRDAGRISRLAEAVARELDAAGCAARVFALSFDLDTLVLLGELSPATATFLNRGRPRPRRRALERCLAPVAGLSVDVRIVSPELVATAHAAGKPVLVWTCNHRPAVGAALASGADGILSDRPQWLRRTVAELSGKLG